MRRLATPRIQTRVMALVHSVLALLMFTGVVPVEWAAYLHAIFAASAELLRAWYSAPGEGELPRWLEEK